MDSLIIPENKEGKQNDLAHSALESDNRQANNRFNRTLKRLMNPNMWHELSGILSARFILRDNEGQDIAQSAKVGDLISIDLPGPGTVSGEGYDWVRIEKFEHKTNPSNDEELFAMLLRPCANPKKDGAVAHFFRSTATSTFVLRRRGNEVSISYHGRNEMPNTHTDNVIDNIRNTAVAAGAALGLSEAQWDSLIKSLLEKDN